MAAIEKVCEFSGEYPSYRMYDYKKNQLQIMPKYRKEFRGATATLYICFDKLVWLNKRYGWKSDYDEAYMQAYEPPFTNRKEWVQYETSVNKEKLTKQFDYCLIVEDKYLQGEVEGKYLNYTTHLPTVKRKLKRLLRCKELNIVYVNDQEEFDRLFE